MINNRVSGVRGCRIVKVGFIVVGLGTEVLGYKEIVRVNVGVMETRVFTVGDFVVLDFLGCK